MGWLSLDGLFVARIPDPSPRVASRGVPQSSHGISHTVTFRDTVHDWGSRARRGPKLHSCSRHFLAVSTMAHTSSRRDRNLAGLAGWFLLLGAAVALFTGLDDPRLATPAVTDMAA